MGDRSLLAGVFQAFVLACLCLGLGAALVCPGGNCPAAVMEGRILAGLNAWRAPWLDLLFGTATWLGSMAALGPACLGLAWRLWRRQRRRAALLVCLSLGGAWMLAFIAKQIVRRLRPELFPSLTVLPADFSFPSGHAMQVTAFALAWLFFAREGKGWGGLVAAGAVVGVVALSRPYLQVHFPSDVLFGVLAAAAWVLGLRLSLTGRPWRTAAASDGLIKRP